MGCLYMEASIDDTCGMCQMWDSSIEMNGTDEDE